MVDRLSDFRVAARAARVSAAVYFLNQVPMYLIITALLTDPSNYRLAPLFQSLDGLTLSATWLGLIPIVLAMHRLIAPVTGLDKAARVIGIAGAASLAILMLLNGVTASEHTAPNALVSLAALLVGIWITLVSFRSLRTGAMSQGVGWVGMVTGSAVVAREFFGVHLGAVLIGVTNVVGLVGLLAWLILLSRQLARVASTEGAAVSVTGKTEVPAPPVIIP